MAFTFSSRGTKRAIQMLKTLQSRGGTVMRDVKREINRRHALAMRRRHIPEDTGRLRASLTEERHPDRWVSTSPSSIAIGTRVPYARYQRHRIRRLNRQEIEEIVAEPIWLAFHEAVKGGGT